MNIKYVEKYSTCREYTKRSVNNLNDFYFKCVLNVSIAINTGIFGSLFDSN